MVNEKILKSKMMLTDINTFGKLAKAIGISRNALYEKRAGATKITTVDITRIKETLDLTDDEVIEIFFGGK